MTTIKKKCWVTVIPDWKGGSALDVFFYEDEAIAKAKVNHLHKKVIQATLTYTLPTPKHTKR